MHLRATPESRGFGALDGGEDEIKEVCGGGLWEKVEMEEGSKHELEAHGGGGLIATGAEEGEVGEGEDL